MAETAFKDMQLAGVDLFIATRFISRAQCGTARACDKDIVRTHSAGQ